MNDSLAQQAIESALSGNWEKAVEVNLKILDKIANDLDALNRLARAYAELGNINKAKENSNKVIEIDPFNSIALKALAKWKNAKRGDPTKSITVDPTTFLEEPGKTKTVNLINLGSTEIISKLDAGDRVQLDYHCHRIAVATLDGKYIGRLPDDLSLRIKNLVKKGNEYEATIMCIAEKEIKIFIRETQKGPDTKDMVSFPLEKIDYPSTTREKTKNSTDTFSLSSTE